MKKGEIWIASLEPKKGSEVGKQRPVVIVQTDLLNDAGHPTVIVLPISSQLQEENVLRFRIKNSCFERGYGYALVDQIRAIDVNTRLKKRIGSLAEMDITVLTQLIHQVLD
jgi:mRNA interferase MazF